MEVLVKATVKGAVPDVGVAVKLAVTFAAEARELQRNISINPNKSSRMFLFIFVPSFFPE
jgi:hypothetical protein